MLLVKTKLDVSPIEGIGLFADELIAKGTVIWKFHPLIDLRFPKEALLQLSPSALEQARKYCYHEKDSDLYVLCGDDARFFNHSNKPNCLDTYKKLDGFDHLQGVTLAIRDIKRGEELTCNYALFDMDFVERECEASVDVFKENEMTIV